MTPSRSHGRASAALVLLLALWAAGAPAQEIPAPPTDSTVPDAATVEIPPPAFQAVQDSAATDQLRALFQRIDGLREVAVEVDGGVATLEGRALTPEARQTAVELAGGRDGVLYVADRMEVETSLRARLGPVMARLREQATSWIASLPLVLVALLVLGLFGFLAGRLARWRTPFRRVAGAPFVEDLARRGVAVVVWITGLLLALELLDATALVGAVLGAAGVAGIAFGFAFRNIAENWLAGILLGLRRPFAPDDQVSIDGNQGKVVRLTHSDTVLMTPAGNHLRLPNASVFNGVVENFTRNPLRRFTVRLTMPRDVSTSAARAAILSGLADCPGVGADPPPQAMLAEVGDSHQALEIHGWVDQTEWDFVATRSLAYRKAKEALAGAGIPGPFSEHTVYMGPEDAPGSAAYRAPEPDVEETVEEVTEADPTSDRLVAEDRERSEETDLLGGG